MTGRFVLSSGFLLRFFVFAAFFIPFFGAFFLRLFSQSFLYFGSVLSFALIQGGFRHYAFAFPLIILAQDGLVLFQLAFEFAEGLLATGTGVFRGACSVQRASGQRQIHRKRVLFLVRIFRERAVQLH